MNIKKSTFFISLSIFLLWSCTTKQNRQQENIHRQWMLVSFQNYSKEVLMQHQAELNLSILTEQDGQYSAYMGCNRLMVTGSKMKGNSIHLEVTGATMSYCDGKMELEKKFIQALPQMKKFSIEGHYLTLEDEKGQKMKFVAADWD